MPNHALQRKSPLRVATLKRVVSSAKAQNFDALMTSGTKSRWRRCRAGSSPARNADRFAPLTVMVPLPHGTCGTSAV